MPTLVVQKGHCYRTTGATGTAGEQAFATSVADSCVALLNGRNGWTVRVILADDPSGSYHGDAFAAIHGDGSLNTSVRGASVGYRTPEGQEFGQAWKRAYAARGWSGGFRPDNYTVALAQYYGTGTAASQGNRRAVIVECGFLTSPEDRALLTGPGGPDRVALAIGDALGISTSPPAPISSRKDFDMPHGTLPPRTDPATPGRVAIAMPALGGPGSTVTGARVHMASGWGNVIKYKVWCVDERGIYTNANAKIPYEYQVASDRPGWFPVPIGTAQVAIEYTTTSGNSQGSYTVEFFYA